MDYTPQILRTLRKYFGLHQVDLAQIIGVGQGTISKLESGQLELSAVQWISLCRKYNLDPKVLQTGRIEAIDNLKISVHNQELPGNFNLPAKYKLLMGSTVRTVYPFLKFMEHKIGFEKTVKYLKSIHVDYDYFTIQNLPINMKIIEDIFNELEKLGLLNIKNVNTVLEVVPASEVHSYILGQLPEASAPDRKFKKFTSEIARLYEVNSHYDFVGDKHCFVKVRDNAHVVELGLSEEFKKFRQLYNLSHYNKLSPLLFSENKFKVETQDNGWDLVIA